ALGGELYGSVSCVHRYADALRWLLSQNAEFLALVFYDEHEVAILSNLSLCDDDQCEVDHGEEGRGMARDFPRLMRTGRYRFAVCSDGWREKLQQTGLCPASARKVYGDEL